MENTYQRTDYSKYQDTSTADVADLLDVDIDKVKSIEAEMLVTS